MERSLHRQLKERYGPGVGGESEVTLDGFRIDAVTPSGRLIEIQTSPLGLLKRKLAILLPHHEVCVVKPVVVARRIIRRQTASGEDLSSRRSPKRDALIDVFDELVGLAHLFPHPNLTIELTAVEIDEIRIIRTRRPGFSVFDRSLTEMLGVVLLRSPEGPLVRSCRTTSSTRSLPVTWPSGWPGRSPSHGGSPTLSD